MGQFVNPFTDIGFKRIFGQEISKPLIIDFLNNLLEGERKITDLSFLDKEIPAQTIDGRSLIYDLYCKDEKDEYFIVEMQNKSQPYFKDRSIYYASQAIAQQGEKGLEWEYKIHAVYLVAMLNFSLPDIGTTFRTDVALMDMKSKELFSEKMRMIYLQLPYFKKEAETCENDFERWIYVLKHMETLNRLPWMAQNSVFKRLAQIADISSLTKEERIKYDKSIKQYRDALSVYEGARLSGRAEGRVEGRVEGRAEGRAEGLKEGEAKGLQSTARNMKAKGFSTELIMEVTGLTAEAIEAL